MEETPKDWKLKLRYGKLKTEFSHFTVIADGLVETPDADYGSIAGKAMMGIKVWAIDTQEAADLTYYVGEQIGFKPTGNMQVFDTDPEQPPKDTPYGYDINFTSYDE